MFEKVLIPTDLSEASDRLVACAESIGNVREIILLHIVRNRQKAKKERESLERQKKLVRSLGIAVRYIITDTGDGEIPAAILKIAAAEEPALILMGARRGLLSRTLLGHGDTEVLTKSRTHVLVMRFPGQGLFAAHGNTPETPLFARVLFPIDFSRPANTALASVREMDGISEIILLHVIRKVEGEERMNVVLPAVEKHLAGAREMILRDRPEIRVKTLVRFGDPARQIGSMAEEEGATLVMMSRYGRMDYIRKIPLGTTTSKVTAQTSKPVLVMFTAISLEITTRELQPAEFSQADRVWTTYHQTKADREHDRIFAVFIEDTPVSIARCKQHNDGYEVDGVFTEEEFRGNGYSRMALEALVRACGAFSLSMYAVRHLVDFYASFGFVPVKENDLPQSVRTRYSWAMGEMEGAEVCPMIRPPSGTKG